MADELVAVADDLAKKLLECQVASVTSLIKAGQILREYQSQLPHGDMTAIYNSGRLPLGQRYGQMLSAIAANRALCDPVVIRNVPHAITALAVLSPVHPSVIEIGVAERTLHRGLTRQGVVAAVRKLRTQALHTSQPSAARLL